MKPPENWIVGIGEPNGKEIRTRPHNSCATMGLSRHNRYCAVQVFELATTNVCLALLDYGLGSRDLVLTNESPPSAR
ncbi:hypothetical protein MUP37_02940, partial [Candidatus Bathyarchaeota archaeon]|nr:hypothetical protein [Candidatus Bathyarchaeota archaeon]